MPMNSPEHPTQNRRIRVFVSSTFRDMVEDRNALMTHAWPELRRFCRERQVELVEVDLRWGIAEEQSTRKETLKLCLDEIRACRPFFIGLLGERYGWLPGDDAFTADLLEEQPWLAQLRDRSVTELEIMHGVLREEQMHGRAFFYFRDPKYVEYIPSGHRQDFTAENTVVAEKLSRLKQQIRAASVEQVCKLRENYPNPQRLAELVLEDLKAVIDAEFPVARIPDSLTREARDHEAFAETRRRTYIGRPEYFTALDQHAMGDGKPLVLLGETGSGKSALLANWIDHWCKSHPNDFIFQHYIGGTPDSAEHWRLMSRLVAEIKHWTDDPEELPKSHDDILRSFTIWLVKARLKAERNSVRFIIVLDALNQLEDCDHAKLLGWLPSHPFTGPLRLIVSMLPGDTLEAVQKRGWASLCVQPLTSDERRRMIADYLARFGKKFDAPRLERLSAAPAAANPLYLKILLDELRVTGTHEQLDERLDEYLAAPDIPSLLNKLLARYQRDYERDRPGLVAEVLGLIWAARRGLTESELLRLLKPADKPQLAPAIWNPLRAALEDGLVDRGGILNFAHDFLRTAVGKAFVPDENKVNEVRLRLADYFEAEPVTPRSCDEFAWLLWRREDRERLRECILNISRFQIIYHRREDDLYTYWLWLDERTTMGLRYLEAYDRWCESHSDDSLRDKSWSAHELAMFLDQAGQFSTAAPLYEKALGLIEQFSGVDAPEVAQTLRSMADLRRTLGQVDEASALLRRALTIDERWYEPDDPVYAKDLVALALVLQLTASLEEAVLLLQQALQIQAKRFGPQSIIYAKTLINLADVLVDAGEELKAEAHYREALEITERNSAVSLSAHVMGSMAELLQRRGLLDEAEQFHIKAIDIRTRLYGPDHIQVSDPLNNYACFLLETNRLDEAEPRFKRGLAIKKAFLGEGHHSVAKAYANLAAALDKAGNTSEAYKHIRDAVRIYEALPASARDASEYAVALSTLGVVLGKQGDVDDSIAASGLAITTLLAYAKKISRLPDILPRVVINYIRGSECGGLAPQKIVDRLREMFGHAHALDILPDVMKSLKAAESGEKCQLPKFDWVDPEVAVDSLSKEQRQAVGRIHTALSRHVSFHLDRVARGGHVPTGICEHCHDLFERHGKGIALRTFNSFNKREDVLKIRCTTTRNPVLLLISVFSCPKCEVVRKLSAMSREQGLGYISLVTEVFNTWPSPELTVLFHLVICMGENGFEECHTGFFDLEGRLTRPMEYSIVPIELLSSSEKGLMHL